VIPGVLFVSIPRGMVKSQNADHICVYMAGDCATLDFLFYIHRALHRDRLLSVDLDHARCVQSYYFSIYSIIVQLAAPYSTTRFSLTT
jgi:hypothetical protein